MLAPAQRKNDAVIVITQDNEARYLEIAEANAAAEDLTGYKEGELIGKPLEVLLAKPIRQLVMEDITYEPGGADLDEILNKVSDFRLRLKEGKELSIYCKVFRIDPIDGKLAFQFIMRDETLRKDIIANRDSLDGSGKKAMVSRSALEQILAMVLYHVKNRKLEASFALLRIDDFSAIENSYGRERAKLLLDAVARLCRKSLRTEDTIGDFGGNCIGLVLPGASKEGAKIVLNRIRFMVNSNPVELSDMEETQVSISAGYCFMRPEDSESSIFDACRISLQWAKESGGNFVQEADAFPDQS